MVVFTCNTCSAVLKRNKVDSHCYQCRGCESLSCVDCGKDFWGDDYQQHTKCISEEEKYGRKDAVPKVNKGEAKQDQWIEQVQAAIEKASSKPSLKRILERIKQYPNIPRKKAKFENFVKNSLKCYDSTLIAASWDVIMTSKTQSQNENGKELPQGNQTESIVATSGAEKENGHEEEETSAPKNKKERKEERRKKSEKKEKKDKIVETSENTSNDVPKKSKKRKRQESEVLDDNDVRNCGNDEGDSIKKKKKKSKKREDESTKTEDTDECNGDNGLEEEEEEEPPKKRKKTKFDWEMVIKAVLEKKGELSLKKLKRKVLSEFAAQDAANYNEDNLSAKFDKKVVKIAGVKVFKDRVCLKV